MKRTILLLCALCLVLTCGTVFAAPPGKGGTTLNDIPPAWSKTLQCDTTTCPRFEMVMNGTAVLDHETGLVWEQSPSTNPVVWYNAQTHCAYLAIGGRLGWRLPAIQELASLVDPSESYPALPSGHPFSNDANFFWSATSEANDTGFALGVYFYVGMVGNIQKGYTSAYAWCVRGGQGMDAQ